MPQLHSHTFAVTHCCHTFTVTHLLNSAYWWKGYAGLAGQGLRLGSDREVGAYLHAALHATSPSDDVYQHASTKAVLRENEAV